MEGRVLKLLIAICLISITGCDLIPQERMALDYTDPTLWYIPPQTPPNPSPDTTCSRMADIFYILPTCVWDWQDKEGATHHYANINDAGQREAMRPSYELAEEIFGSACRYYAPYYRQVTLDAWVEGNERVEELFPVAMNDIRNAFAYYHKRHNKGRPFVLAGFSQGGKAVVELLKELPDSLSKRMVAAYVIGYRITEEELHTYPTIRPGTDATETGVTLCYNSVATPDAAAAVLSPSAVCHNPVTWGTTSAPAQVNDSVTAKIDPINHLLIVEGVDSDAAYLPILGKIFPKGNYHLQELTLYKEHLQHNVRQRVNNYITDGKKVSQ